ncbi:hypothetical protein, partial [Hydrogenovibrio marinus]
MSILDNAISSIKLGLEDFQSDNPSRITLSCARNLYSGILLLFKHKLAQLSEDDTDEALIKERISPIKTPEGIKWVGKGSKTVDLHKIQERLTSLEIGVDWKRVSDIQQYRNEIEHYYTQNQIDSIRKLISDTFIVINDFVRNYLDSDPQELLGVETWAVLIETKEVYEAEKNACNEVMETLTYESPSLLLALKEFKCQDCGSDLIEPIDNSTHSIETEYMCRSCHARYTPEEIIPAAISEYYYPETYLAVTDGGEIPYCDCPSCWSSSSYIYDEGVCVICGHSANHTCLRC